MLKLNRFYVSVNSKSEAGIFFEAFITKNKCLVRKSFDVKSSSKEKFLANDVENFKVFSKVYDLTEFNTHDKMQGQDVQNIYKEAVKKYGVRVLPFLPVQALGQTYEDSFLDFCKEYAQEACNRYAHKANITYSDLEVSNRKIRENNTTTNRIVKNFEKEVKEHKDFREDFMNTIINPDGSFIELI